MLGDFVSEVLSALQSTSRWSLGVIKRTGAAINFGYGTWIELEVGHTYHDAFGRGDVIFGPLDFGGTGSRTMDSGPNSPQENGTRAQGLYQTHGFRGLDGTI
eukprot:TCALIF_07221-PB protein Name:"Protein of unknown function" AED:0.45 eAED:1.00 QI:0/0/0/1/0/0/3/0/101